MSSAICNQEDCMCEFVIEDNIYEYDDRMMKCPKCCSHQQIPRTIIIEKLLSTCTKGTADKLKKELEEMGK